MSNPGNKSINPLAALVITGNPKVDTILRYVLFAIASGLTVRIVGWLGDHGFNDPNLLLMVGGAVLSTVVAGALMAWGVVRSSKIELIVQLREAIAVQAGIAAASSPSPTPDINTVADAQKVIAEHAPDNIPPVK